MVRCSVKYDEELKEQVFFVRGDEDYARSTSTVLRVGDVSTDTYDFSVSIYVNVFRDKGEGSIVIYDNDEVVYVIDDWRSTDNEREITFEHMDYDTEHIFTAKYMGNKQCSPSSSNSETVYVEDTQRFQTSLAINGVRQFKPNEGFVKTITLSREDSSLDGVGSQDIIVYVDDVRYTTIETQYTGITREISFNGLSQGLHTIRAEYMGSRNLTSSNTTQTISVGYNIQAISYPSLVVAYNNYNYVAKVTDFFGNPVSNVAVDLYSSQSPTSIGTANTNSEGYATFSNEVYSFKFGTTIGSVSYETDIINVEHISINDITVSSAYERLYKAETNNIVVDTGNTKANVPIAVTGAVNTTIYTNSNGIATLDIVGDGTSANKSLTFKVSNSLSKSLQFDDYVQYWAVNDVHNRNYDKFNCNVLDLVSYFRVDAVQGNGFVLLLPIDISKNYEIILTGVSASQASRIWGASKDSSGVISLMNPPIASLRLNNATIKITNNQVTVTQSGSTYIAEVRADVKIGFGIMDITQFTFTKLTMQEIV